MIEVELWCEMGDMLEDEVVGEWLEVYDMLLEGGVMVGVLLLEWDGVVLRGDIIC